MTDGKPAATPSDSLGGQNTRRSAGSARSSRARSTIFEKLRNADRRITTLLDLLAMNASEEDIQEIISDYYSKSTEYRRALTRQQARYEHADRMLKARQIIP